MKKNVPAESKKIRGYSFIYYLKALSKFYLEPIVLNK